MCIARKLHRSGASSPWSFDVYENAVDTIDLLGGVKFHDLNELSKRAPKLNAFMKVDGVMPALCHNDFYAPNFSSTPVASTSSTGNTRPCQTMQATSAHSHATPISASKTPRRSSVRTSSELPHQQKCATAWPMLPFAPSTSLYERFSRKVPIAHSVNGCFYGTA